MPATLNHRLGTLNTYRLVRPGDTARQLKAAGIVAKARLSVYFGQECPNPQEARIKEATKMRTHSSGNRVVGWDPSLLAFTGRKVSLTLPDRGRTRNAVGVQLKPIADDGPDFWAVCFHGSTAGDGWLAKEAAVIVRELGKLPGIERLAIGGDLNSATTSGVRKLLTDGLGVRWIRQRVSLSRVLNNKANTSGTRFGLGQRYASRWIDDIGTTDFFLPGDIDGDQWAAGVVLTGSATDHNLVYVEGAIGGPVTPPPPGDTEVEWLKLMAARPPAEVSVAKFNAAREGGYPSKYAGIVQGWLGRHRSARWSGADQTALDEFRRREFPTWTKEEASGPAGVKSLQRLAAVAKSKGLQTWPVSR